MKFSNSVKHMTLRLLDSYNNTNNPEFIGGKYNGNGRT